MMKHSADSNYNFLLAGAATHIGLVRKANEDSMTRFESSGMQVFVVCDGMGGHIGGEIASKTAITAIRDYFTNNISPDPREMIHNAIVAANEAILTRVNQQPDLTGMGSTCVMLIVTSDGKVFYGHVGDSRIYIVANHHITQLTKDHSLVQELFDSGIIKNREDMERHPRKNEITNALGIPGMKPPTVCNNPIEPDSGNCFLLCSDGLTNMVSDEQIKRVISKHTTPIQQRAEKLVQMANDNGGIDNITVELVEFALGAQDINTSESKKTEKGKSILPFVLAAIIIFSGIAGWFLSRDSKPVLETENEEIVTEVNRQLSSYYFTRPILFTQVDKSTIVTEIVDFPKNDTIFLNSITTDRSISIEKIEGKYISLQWKEKPANDTIEVICKTNLSENCMIKIPVQNKEPKPQAAPQISGGKILIKEITLQDTVYITCNGKDCTGEIFLSNNSQLKKIKWSREKILESGTVGQLPTNSKNIKADIIDDKTGKISIVWEKDKGDLPNNVMVICKTFSGEIYHITMSLEVKTEQEENAVQKQEIIQEQQNDEPIMI